MRETRIEELMKEMKSFGKEVYHKRELLGEMLFLQQELVNLTFNEEHATSANLKIWDVVNHLEELNEECGHVADTEVDKFRKSSKCLNNLIKAEISGERGEYKAFKALENLKGSSKVVKNVELADGDLHTELDAVVITPKCLTIVEVKNTAKNIFIDEEGNYYRTGEFLRLDCNIADKIRCKETLLRKVLEDAGYDNLQIRSIVVFTNNRIEVQNKYRSIRTSFLNHLTYLIEGFDLEDSILDDQMDEIEKAIVEASNRILYPFEFDTCQYKKDFAELMVTLEMAKMAQKSEIEKEELRSIQSTEITDKIKSIHRMKNFVKLGNAAAIFALGFVFSMFAYKEKKIGKLLCYEGEHPKYRKKLFYQRGGSEQNIVMS